MHAPTRRTLGLAAAALALAGCAGPSTPGRGPDSSQVAPAEGAATLPAGTWMWVATVTPVETIVAPDPARYTIEFLPAGAVQVLADCNRGRGTYTTDASRRLSLGPIALTRMGCPPGSLDMKYTQQLSNTAGWFVRGDTLYVDLKMDSGTMRFAKKG